MAGRTYSLRLRLILLISIPILIAGLVIGGLAFITSWHEIEEVYDAQLVQSAKVLHQLTRHELSEHDSSPIDLISEMRDWGYKYEQNIAFRIWQNGRPITQSRNTRNFAATSAPPGLSDQTVGDEKWRVFVYIDSSTGVTVETSERYEIRYELIRYLTFGLLLPAGLFVPAVLLLVWYGTSKSLRPLRRLSAEVDQRHAEDTSEIRADNIPDEAGPLISALNRLLERLGDSIQREREFTDNAAHELRTPLAAIKTQTQVLHRKLQSNPEYRGDLKNLLASIDRVAHMLEQMLSLARLQKGDDLPFEEIDLSELTAEVIRDLVPQASEKNQQLVLESTSNVRMRGNREGLAMLMRNLVDNAIKYSPDESTITVRLADTGESIVFGVSDNGPGIPDGEKPRVLERFYRGSHGTVTGSGLGLSIVKWVADQHSASLRLTNLQPSGLRCELTFA